MLRNFHLKSERRLEVRLVKAGEDSPCTVRHKKRVEIVLPPVERLSSCSELNFYPVQTLFEKPFGNDQMLILRNNRAFLSVCPDRMDFPCILPEIQNQVRPPCQCAPHSLLSLHILRHILRNVKSQVIL